MSAPPTASAGAPAIPAAIGGGPRPLWSVMIPAFNPSDHLRETLEGVLAQGLAADTMQVEVVDDSSTGDTSEQIAAAVGRGRISVFRQPANVGAPANFNTCIARARGHLVHVLHCDDGVLPGFYEAYGARFADPEILAVAGPAITVAGDGWWEGVSPRLPSLDGRLARPLDVLAARNVIRTPAIAVRRTAYEAAGGFDPDFPHCADWEMWSRLAALGPIGVVDRPYALYRVHAGSDTSRLTAEARNIREVLACAERIIGRLPAGERRTTARAAMRAWLQDLAQRQALSWLRLGNHTAFARNARFAVTLQPTPASRCRVALTLLVARARGR